MRMPVRMPVRTPVRTPVRMPVRMPVVMYANGVGIFSVLGGTCPEHVSAMSGDAASKGAAERGPTRGRVSLCASGPLGMRLNFFPGCTILVAIGGPAYD